MFIEEEITLAELAERVGILDLKTPHEYEISNFEFQILSYDHEKKCEVYSLIENFIVKNSVNTHYELGILKGTSNHRVFDDEQQKYIHLKDHPNAKLINDSIDVVDLSVKNTKNYFANEHLNHNTTPGGQALPFHSTIRIRLTGQGSGIKDAHGNVIGIKVPLKIIKNKIASPQRMFSLEIHFGKGIDETESLLDVAMEYTKQHEEGFERNGRIYKMSGAAWRTFQVSTKDGEILHEQKFQRPGFAELLYRDPINSPLLMEYFDGILTQTFGVANDENVTQDSPSKPNLDEEGNEV